MNICILKRSININIQETNYKLYPRLYSMSVNQHTLYLLGLPKGQRNSYTPGVHVPFYNPFWLKIHSLIAQITDCILDYRLAHFCFHYSDLPVQRYKHSFMLNLVHIIQRYIANSPIHSPMLHLLSEATSVIPRHWKLPDAPTIQV